MEIHKRLLGNNIPGGPREYLCGSDCPKTEPESKKNAPSSDFAKAEVYEDDLNNNKYTVMPKTIANASDFVPEGDGKGNQPRAQISPLSLDQPCCLMIYTH